jgi:hypothetical protein
MHILVEGCDRIGKTTTIAAMRELLPEYEVRKPRAPKTEGEARSIYADFFQALSEPGNIIWDRSHISELVYANLYRDYNPLSWIMYLEKFAIGQNPFIKIIYYYPVWGNLLGEDERPGADRVAELNMYDRALNHFTFLDVTRQSVHHSNKREWLSPELRASIPLRESFVLL